MKYTPKTQLKVNGKMNSKDTGIVGKRLAIAAIVAAAGVSVGAACTGVAALLQVFVR
jgi:hypothetical protein